MKKKELRNSIKGSPLHFDLIVDGELISYELVCPMCRFKTFVVSLDKEWGGCANEDCPGVCFGRIEGGAIGEVGWVT